MNYRRDDLRSKNFMTSWEICDESGVCLNLCLVFLDLKIATCVDFHEAVTMYVIYITGLKWRCFDRRRAERNNLKIDVW